MLRNFGIDDFAPMGLQAFEHAFLARCYQARIARSINGETLDGGED